MKTKYTKKQIQESIRYWENQLKKMNETVDSGIDPSFVQSCAKSLKNMQKALEDLEIVRMSESFDKMPLGFKKDFDKLLDMSRAIETMIAVCEQQKVLESMDAENDSVVQAICVGMVNDNAFDASGIHDKDGIYFEFDGAAADFAIKVNNIQDLGNDMYLCDIVGGFTNAPEKSFGKMQIKVTKWPSEYDFESIVDNAPQFARVVGNSKGLQVAFDAAADAKKCIDNVKS